MSVGFRLSKAVMRLPASSFLLDGEAIVTDDRGLAVFDLIRHKRHGADAVLLAGQRRQTARATTEALTRV